MLIIDQLAALWDELSRHFAEEEDGGCIEEAVCRCPSMSREAQRLELQHETLLDQLEQLIVRCCLTTTTGECADGVKQEFEEFSQQLHMHEDVENRILQHAFGGSFGIDEPCSARR